MEEQQEAKDGAGMASLIIGLYWAVKPGYLTRVAKLGLVLPKNPDLVLFPSCHTFY